MTVWTHTKYGRIEGIVVAQTDTALHICLTADTEPTSTVRRGALAGAILPLRRTDLTEIIRPTVAQLLDFAARHPGRHDSRTDMAIRDELRITPSRYLQLLLEAIRTPEALQHDPQTTGRLIRETDHAAESRARRLNP